MSETANKYGEPWKVELYVPDVVEHWLRDVNGTYVALVNRGGGAERPCETAQRIASCVNACAGMADPEAEVKAMREALAEAANLVKSLHYFQFAEKCAALSRGPQQQESEG